MSAVVLPASRPWHTNGVLTFATLGMLAYGMYSIAWALVDIVRGAQLEWWAELGIMIFGVLLVLSVALVRSAVPGGLFFAGAALLGLQSSAVHTAAHLGSGLAPQIARAVLGACLLVLAWSGTERQRRRELAGSQGLRHAPRREESSS